MRVAGEKLGYDTWAASPIQQRPSISIYRAPVAMVAVAMAMAMVAMAMCAYCVGDVRTPE